MAAKKQPTAKKKPAKKQTAKKASSSSQSLVNHVAFVIDRSLSMFPIRAEVVAIVNAQIAALQELTQQSGQATFVSLYTFHSTVDRPAFFASTVGRVRGLRQLTCRGTTALHDATAQAIRDLKGVDGAATQRVSFLVIVLTDGHENASQLYKDKLAPLLKTAHNTARWTFAFLVPQGGIPACQRLGIPDGNILGWTPTKKGLGLVQRALRSAVARFYAARGEGERSSAAFFGFSRRTPAPRL